MKKEIRFTIPLTPVTKKNSQQIIPVKGRYIPIPSSAYKRYEKDCAAFVPRRAEPLDLRINLCCKYYMPTRRRVDLGNLLSATCDMLTKLNFLADDNCKIVAGHDGSRVYHDKDNPRTEIIITLLEEDQ